MTSKDLANQIRSNTRVILPNFGAFLQKSTDDGTFDANGITFSPFLRYNDGVLETQIAKLKGIGIDSAAKEIAALTDEIARSIAQTKCYKIDDLGYLVQDSNRNITFKTSLESEEQATVSEENKSTSDSYVIEEEEQPNTSFVIEEETAPIPTPEVQPQQPVENVDETFENEEVVVNEEPFEIENSAPTEQTNSTPIASNPSPSVSKQNTEPKLVEPENEAEPSVATISTRNKILFGSLFVIVSIAIIIGIAYLIRNTVFSSQIAVETPKPIVTTEALSTESTVDNSTLNAPKDSIDKAFDAMPEDKPEPTKPTPQEVETKIEKAVVQAAQEANNAANFYLVVGSFKERSNAEELVNKLKPQNINPIIVARPNSTFAVSIDSYATRADANAAKQKYSQQFPAAWVMSKP